MTIKNFLGMPIEGVHEYSRGQKRVPQLSQEEVGVLIHAVLDHPLVRGLAFTQYTPFYNDGEPCVFRVGEPYISIPGLDEVNPDWYDYGWMRDDGEENNRHWISPYDEQFEKLIGDDAKDWTGDWPNRVGTYKVAFEDQPQPALFEAFMALNDAMNSGSCDHALLDLFGDHATVVIDKESGKVVVNEYDHD